VAAAINEAMQNKAVRAVNAFTKVVFRMEETYHNTPGRLFNK
jgi:hypothetical protein